MRTAGKGLFAYAGISVSNIGDVNGDSVDDMIVGATGVEVFGNTYAGQAYVIFGRTDGIFPAAINLTSLDGTYGFVINGKTSCQLELPLWCSHGSANAVLPCI